MDVTDAVAGERQRVVGLADVLRVPVRRWRTVLAVTAVITLAVLGYLLFVPTTHHATTVVVLRPVVTDPFTLPSGGADRAINMTAENGIATGNEVVDSTAQVLRRSADDVRDALEVEVPTGGQVLRFRYSAEVESEAVTGANTAAETYLRVRTGIYAKQRDALLRSYDKTVDQITEQLRVAQRELPSRQSSSPRTQAALERVNSLNDQLAQLANQRAKISSADLSPGAVTAAARTPTPSSHDAGVLLLLGGLLGGALLGMIAAHLQELLDRRVRSAEQAAELTGLPALGVVRASGRRGDTAGADARYVAMAVLNSVGRHPDRPLVVLSSRADEQRTTITGNLAVAMAEAGHDIYLVGTTDNQEELRRILFAAQKRTPPVHTARRQTGQASVESADGSGEPDKTAVIVVPAVAKAVPSAATRPVGASQDPEATLVMSPMKAAVKPPVKPPVTPGASAAVAGSIADGVVVPGTGGGAPLVVLIGPGAVRLGPLEAQPAGSLLVIDAPPSDSDERGVRVARAGTSLLVVARDRTRARDLARLAERLRSAGVRSLGFVLTGGGGA